MSFVRVPAAGAKALAHHTPVAGNGAAKALANALAVLEPKAGQVRLYTPASAAKEIDRLGALGVQVKTIGRSTEDRPIFSLKVGEGPVKIAAISGSHADEPVGTATLLHLAEQLQTNPALAALRQHVTLDLVPMVNPDGSQRNAAWFKTWEQAPNLRGYLQNVVRDPASADVEWGYPTAPGDAIRPENQAVASWLRGLGRLDHYASLHSMFFGGGALLLVSGANDSLALKRRAAYANAARQHGLPLHAYNRFGEKGHTFLAPGFQTAPTAEAMTDFFGPGTFRRSSMAYAHANNQLPFAAVTEVSMVYDPRINLMVPVKGQTRAEAQQQLSAALTGVGHEVLKHFTALAANANPADPAVALQLKRVRGRIDAHLRNAEALNADLARYRNVPATVGNQVFDSFLVTRRRAELLHEVANATQAIVDPNGGAARTALHDGLERAYQKLENQFELQYPTLEAHSALQTAAVLSGLLK
jgi:hypothetical protein